MTGSVAAAMAVLPLTPLTHLFAQQMDPELELEPEPNIPPAPLGRVANAQVAIREAPKTRAQSSTWPGATTYCGCTSK